MGRTLSKEPGQELTDPAAPKNHTAIQFGFVRPEPGGMLDGVSVPWAGNLVAGAAGGWHGPFAGSQSGSGCTAQPTHNGTANKTS